MSQITTLSINDGTSAQSFSPSSTVGNNVVFHDRASSDTAAGQHRLVLGFSPSTYSRKTDRVTLTLELPVPTGSGADVSFVDTARANLQIVIPTNTTSAQRLQLVSLLANALDNTEVKKYVTDLEPMY